MRHYDESLIRQVLAEINSGRMSQGEAARHYKIPKQTIQGWLSKRINNRSNDQSQLDLNTPINALGRNGSVEINTLDKPLSLDDLIKLFNINTNEWICELFKPNSWEGFIKLKTGSGGGPTTQKVRLYQSKAIFKRVVDPLIRNQLIEWLNKNSEPLAPNSLTPLRRTDELLDGQTVIWGMWDAHLGMYAWNTETNNDYDLPLATKRIKNSIDDMIGELADYPIRQIIMPIGNDFLHFDNVRNTTTYGHHYLDCDTRYAKVYIAALECLAYLIERAIQLTDNVQIVLVPGNHDQISSFTLAVALAQRFRHYQEVTFDLSPNPRKYVHWGSVIVAFDHGNNIKNSQWPLIFSTEPGAKEYISKSTWREVQLGHIHQKHETMWSGITPLNGLLVRVNPSLCNVDFWHHSKGLLGEPIKSVEAWRYNNVGYIGSHVAWARD